MKLAALQLVEQVRMEPDVFAKAKLLKQLTREHEIPLKTLSENLRLSSSYLCHLLRLNKLPYIVIDGYYSKLITLSHLFSISRLSSTDKMQELYEHILTESLTVAQTESVVRELLYNIKSVGVRISADEIEQLRLDLQKINPQCNVFLIQTRIKGKLIIELSGNHEETSIFMKKIFDLLKKF